jgi:Ca-activated chloride channel homolog
VENGRVRNARIAVIVLAAVAVIVAAVVSLRGGDDGGGSATGATTGTTSTGVTTAPSGAVKVLLAYSPEKDAMLTELIARYNDEGHEVNGREVFVEGQNWSSGESESKIANGTFKPTAWSPSSSLWGRLLNFEVDRAYVADENPSLVRTPLVIAMWEAEAKALGWPRRQTSWAQILKMATSSAGWEQFGLPTYGRFRLGHTNPDFSTSGLSAVVAQYYAVTGKHERLTAADVSRPAARNAVRQIQASVVHYGDTTLFFADQLKAHGPAYASAVAMEEVTLLDYNRTRPAGAERLVAEYPSDGTFYSDDPYLTLAAPWVTPAQKQASDELGAWLVQQIDPALAAKYGFRPGDRTKRAVAPIDRKHGVLPEQPALVLELPSPRVLATIKRFWHADRKPANVQLVVDVSASMQQGNRINEAIKGLQTFLRQLSPRDRVGLLWFNDELHDGVPIAPFASNAAQLRSTVDNLIADGSTALYDATARGVGNVDGLRDDSRINAVVVLTDGMDTASKQDLDALVARLRTRSESEGRQIRVFTIAYGDEADVKGLEKIAAASGGKPFVGDPTQIEKVYLQISSFF